MVVLSKPAIIENFSSPVKTDNQPRIRSFVSGIPVIELSKPNSRHLIVKACEEFGFFKVINHGISTDLITDLETESVKFFSLPLSQKQKSGPPDPFGYGNKRIGPNGDVGWVEYLLLTTNLESKSNKLNQNTEKLRCALDDYISSVKKMACEILELMAEGLRIEPRNVLSKLIMDEQSDSVFRLNHYPPCPEPEALKKNENGDVSNKIGFGEHTDPQIISVLRSNNTSGLEISLKNGRWVSIPPDQSSFFINIGDSLQVMTNGRFRSVKHRALADALESRYSMVFFAAPSFSTKIVPLSSLFDEGEEDQEGETLYKEFTWWEYKKSVYKTKLTADRLRPFEKSAGAG